MSMIEIKKIGITKLDTDAIVNAANEGLLAGGGVCGAIFAEAGHHRLQEACDKIGHCKTGSAVITPAFDLPAKYVIHAVGPVWRGGGQGEPKQLYGAYYRSLELAVINDCKSIAFPLISSGIFGYPIDQAWEVAFKACHDFLKQNYEISIKIIFAVLRDEMVEKGEQILTQSDARIYKKANRYDWNIKEMPKQNDTFILERTITPQQMMILEKGNIPVQMEDKWFWYVEDHKLYAHRSWTGFCIFTIEFRPDNHHVVTVNRDPEQFTSKSTADDVVTLNKLLDWWTNDPYDYYNQWIYETLDDLKKAGLIKEHLKIGDQEVDAVFFHKPEEPNGFLSNWFIADFDLDGIHFTSVEQYIMYRKCMLFGDTISAEAVLSTSDTKKQQEIGRNCKGYIHSIWSGMRQMVLLRGLLAKFTQNIDLREHLLNTDDAFLVECARTDRIWACGIRLDDEDRLDAGNWPGKNILGFTLMEVRRMIREESESDDNK